MCPRYGVKHFDNDADFIASCAGPAEAGWRATIAAIDGLAKDKALETQGKRSAIAGILTAWSHLFTESP
jgi:hypothetical protein